MIHKRLYKDGVVSLVVCLFIMIIVSLIALSFAAIMRREQRQAVDHQLNSEAFYAAETGVNDAIEAIANGLTTNITTCDNTAQDKISTSRTLDAAAGVSYSCVFINQSPTELNYEVPDGGLVKVPLHSQSGAIDSIKISWQDPSSTSGTWPTYDGAVGSNFLPTTSWQASWPGMLRLQLIPDAYPIDRATIDTKTVNLFAFPSNATSNFVVGTSPDGSVATGGCDTALPGGRPLFCEIEITNLTSYGYSDYALTLRGIYDESRVIIRAYSGGSPVPLTSGQTVIDSTGLANGIAKRVRVFVPPFNYKYPGFALESGDDICKRFSVTSTGASVDSGYGGVFACDPNTAAP